MKNVVVIKKDGTKITNLSPQGALMYVQSNKGAKIEGAKTAEPIKKKEDAITADFNASIPAVKFAEQNGIDLSNVKGTGNNGQITLKDVKNL